VRVSCEVIDLCAEPDIRAGLDRRLGKRLDDLAEASPRVIKHPAGTAWPPSEHP